MAFGLRDIDVRIRPITKTRPFQVIRNLANTCDELLPFGHSSARRGHAVIPDHLFSVLDGRELTVNGRTWQVKVYGIRDEAGRRWIQLGLEGASTHLVTLRLSPGDGERHAVLKLASWMANPSDFSDEILNVA